MSFLIHHPLEFVGILLIALSGWISFRNRGPENTFGAAVGMLAMTIMGMTGINTDVPIDRWSTGDWIFAVTLAMSLLFAGFSFGIAFGMRLQQKPGAGDAQRGDAVGLS